MLKVKNLTTGIWMETNTLDKLLGARRTPIENEDDFKLIPGKLYKISTKPNWQFNLSIKSVVGMYMKSYYIYSADNVYVEFLLGKDLQSFKYDKFIFEEI